jgi:hypothetical protein
MATQVTAAAFYTAYDAALAAYIADRAGTVDDVYGSGIDMQSTDSGGPWHLANETAFEALDPNSNVPVTLVDDLGNELYQVVYDDHLTAPIEKTFYPLIDNSLEAIFKFWLVQTTIQNALTQVPGPVTARDDWSHYHNLIMLIGRVREHGGLTSGLNHDIYSSNKQADKDQSWPYGYDFAP